MESDAARELWDISPHTLFVCAPIFGHAPGEP
jgi:hypothetical protein